MENSASSSDDEDYGEMPVLTPEVNITSNVSICSVGEDSTTRIRKVRRPRPQLNVSPVNGTVLKVNLNKLTSDLAETSVTSPPEQVTSSINDSDASRNANEDEEDKPGFPCRKCPAILPNTANLKEHLKCHGGQSRYICQYCDYSACRERTIHRHEKLHIENQQIEDLQSAKTDTEDSISRPFILRLQEIERKNAGTEFSINEDVNSIHMNFRRDDDTDELSKTRSVTTPKAGQDFDRTSPSTSHFSNSHRRYANRSSFPKQAASQPESMPAYLNDISSHRVRNQSSTAGNYIVKSLRVTNFMCFKDMRMCLTDMRTQDSSGNVIRLKGEQKSARIVAFLIGLGYDLMQHNSSHPKIACGMTLTSQNIVSRGSQCCSVEITLSLHSVPILEEKYGSHLLLTRHISSTLPLGKSVFEIRSADTNHQFLTIPKFIGLTQVLFILETLNIGPYADLMLLDEETLKRVQEESEMWYEYYSKAVKLKTRDLHWKLNILLLQIDRIDGEIGYKKLKLDFLKSQLERTYPAEEPLFENWRNKDTEKCCKLEKSLAQLTSWHNDFIRDSSLLTLQIQQLSTVYSKTMCDTFQDFLAPLAYTGSVIIDEVEKRLGIWVSGSNSKEDIPTNVEEACSMWENTVHGRQRVGAMGLFLAFWSIIELCPFFAVDSFSSNEVDFHVPSKSLPVVMNLIEKKKTSNQQFCLSVP